jgi:Holliday junction resolvasome RuvABC ATP-dependent DNA helicase subunit
MVALAHSLGNYVEEQFRSALARAPLDPFRPVLVGPPDETLREVFAMLTASGQHEWQLVDGGATHEVIVLLVDGNAPKAANVLSCGCNWDYAVTIRNSRQLVLILAARSSWDTRPESLANTTETLGNLGLVSHGGEDPLHVHLVGAVATHLGLREKQARSLAKLVRTESAKLEPAARDGMSWAVFDRLLATTPGTPAVDTACRAAGFPVLGDNGGDFQESYNVLRGLGKLVGTSGLRDAVDQMKATAAAQAHGLSGSLDSLQVHLAEKLFSPTAFETAPSRYYHVSGSTPTWYDLLSAKVLSDILSELGQGQQVDRLVLACTNALLGVNPLRGGPFIVASAPHLRASSQSGNTPSTVDFSRKVDRLTPEALTALTTDPMDCTDTVPPSHRKPIKYVADALNYRAGTVDVLVLDSFACGGIVVARDAERNGVPVYAARANNWTQELGLPRGGATELIVFHGSNAARVFLTRTGEAPKVQMVQAGAHYVAFNEDLEDNDVFEVSVVDTAGSSVGVWTVQVTIRDLADLSNSRLEALIKTHRTKRTSVPHAPDTLLHRLELSAYLPSAQSWKPVVACWTGHVPSRLAIDWDGDRILGDVQPPIDTRPPLNPPAAVLAARELVRGILNQEQRCVAEIELDRPSLPPLVHDYLGHYLEWLGNEPGAACWLDVFAIHAAEWNAQAGRHVATEEPVVLLLSPLHPLRLAWHVVAQGQLSSSLQKLCPAAGLLTPTQCPDAAALYLWDGQSSKPRAFFSLPCEDVHWAVLANTTFLDKEKPRKDVMQRLADVGLDVQAITGGFTSQQTQDSLREVNRLLPARATLRIGIVGDAESSSECGDGVFRWSEKQHSQENEGVTGSLHVEVFDTRGAADPSPEQLADLAETTAERVRWFKLGPSGDVPRLDLTIIDQLGARSPEAAKGTTRSAIAPASLFRVRVREDFQNARAIIESRVARTRLEDPGLSALLARAVMAYEDLCQADAQNTHFRFTPNQDAVGSRLQNAIFLSVTSSQIDPACVVRGTVGQGGYLWDYELPGVLGGSESSLGYYLVARPTTAMCDAVERAASLVTDSSLNIPGLLEEISRHGIPILKRLASGGSQSRGELGLLLATRLVQDVFRPGETSVRLPVWTGDCIHLVLPVDPYEDLFDGLREGLLPRTATAQRPDLIVVAVQLQPGQPVAIKLTPVEVKYRATGMPATEMRGALGQAANLGKLLQEVLCQALPTDLWRTCAAAVLAQFLDFGFRIYAAPWLHHHQAGEWAAAHQKTMQDILEGIAQITVNSGGRLIVFDGSSTTRVADLDGDSRQDTVVVSLSDAQALLTGTAATSAECDSSVRQLDFSFPNCGGTFAGTSSSQAPTVPIPALSGVGETPPAQSVTRLPVPGDENATPPTVTNVEAVEAPPSADTIVQTSGTSRVPPEIRQRVRRAFEGFIGNEPAVSRLSNDLLRALIEQPPHLAKNYLFTGLPSTGKTELARRMARALDLPFVKLDGRGVSSRDRLFELVNGELRTHNLSPSQIGQQVGLPVLEYPPLIIFIDEVHLVPRALQEALLTMLEAADRTVVLSDHVARVQRATFLFATTRVSDVDAAFASRCDEIQLREYTELEVAHILRWKVPHADWPDSVYQAVARLGRCVPRIAIQLAEALETAVLVSEQEKSLSEHLDDVRQAREIDDRGLTRMDLEYLAILERASGPVGEQNILNLMRTVDKDRILNDVEPFLVRLGFIKHGPRGRELTSEGREYLLAHRIDGHH